jgi:hypothetical protein
MIDRLECIVAEGGHVVLHRSTHGRAGSARFPVARAVVRAAAVALATVLAACAPRSVAIGLPGFAPAGSFGEWTRVLALEPGVTATLVAPRRLDPRRRVDLILYALPNGNTTAQTIGRRRTDGMDWHFDIQHIGAQTRALRSRGVGQAVVVYLEADRKSWPEWRARHGLDAANTRIVAIVDTLRRVLGAATGAGGAGGAGGADVAVTLAGHSGGGSLLFGFIDGRRALPPWLERLVFLDADYNYEARHGARLADWLRADARHTLVVLAYDDRNIMLDGKRVVSDSGGTWRATHRLLDDLATPLALVPDTLGAFQRWRSPQVEILLHPNPANRILHTEMIGEMNGYLHALLFRRPGYGDANTVLKPERVYTAWVER